MLIIMETLFVVFDCTIVNLATYRQFTIGYLRLNYMKFWRRFNLANLAIFLKIAKLKCTKIKCH